jgi:hypothetical protein
MDTLKVGTVHARYHLRPSASAQRARLDRVLGDTMGEQLVRALERAGVPTHAEICIREIYAPVRLSLALTDATLAAAWSEAVALAIRDALASVRPDVVYYPSRGAALADLVARIAVGDLDRAWAWRQLGIATLHECADRTVAALAAADALLDEPRAIVPVLASLAHGGRLQSLVRLLPATAWRTLAIAASREALGDRSATLLDIVDEQALLPSSVGPIARNARQDEEEAPTSDATLAAMSVVGDRSSVDDGFAVRLAERAVEASSIGETLCTSAVELPVARALAVLALLDVEPSALCGSPVRVRSLLRAIQRIADAAAGAAAHSESGRDPRYRPPTRSPSRLGSELSARGATSLEGREVATESQSDRRDGNTPPMEDGRQRGRTRWGGLPFLLNVVEELALPSEILLGALGDMRGLRWVLHQIACTLVPATEEDPAVLAFCGLAPGAVPPSRDVPPPTDEERAVVRRLATDLAEGVHARLSASELVPAALVQQVARRPAMIAADPGWIDVELALDDVDVAVRRGGLDVDPGFVRWLGVVVRFVYA